MRMTSCPRCEATIEEGTRFCGSCGAPQTEDAAEELDELVQRQAAQVATEPGSNAGSDVPAQPDGSAAGGTGEGTGAGTGERLDTGLVGVAVAELSDREKLWRRGCYVAGYATIVAALTRITSPGAWFLLLAGIAIVPPTRRLLGQPLGRPFKREVMAGLYGLFVLLGLALFVVL